ncbi:MAG: PD40 domain-containing protein [Chthonomonadales bacterium]|nr:PD40 domain-containing protein [Chthonomonadales bacterium]
MWRRVARVAAVGTAAIALAGCVTVDFSPDGTKLALTWGVGEGRATLGTIDLKGGEFRALAGGEDGVFPLWSPDGRYLLFQTRQDGRERLRLHDVGAGSTRTIGPDLQPPYAWREDGRRFAGVHRLEDGTLEVVWYNLPEAGVTLRAPVPFKGPAELRMVWLPGTDDLAVVGDTDGRRDIYLVEAGQAHQLTTSGDVVGLALSRDGKRLVWARKSRNPRYILLSLYAFDLASRSVTKLPFPDRVRAVNPDPRHAPESVEYVAFSPDGARLAALVTLPAAPAPGPGKPGGPAPATGAAAGKPRAAIYTITMDGRGAALVYRAQGTGGPGSPVLPAWSRDGSLLGFVAVDGGQARAVVCRADGSGRRVLLSGEAP